MVATLTPTRTVAGQQVPTAGTYQLDASHTDVGFAVKHLMVSKVRGHFSEIEGTVHIGDDPLDSSVNVTIGVSSLDTRNADRDGHLLSADFFDAEQYPTISYRSTGVRHRSGDDYEVDGELTVAGVTRTVPLSLTFEGSALDPWGNGRLGFSASAKVNREDFGLVWNQALETGGVLVGKDVKIEIEAEAIAAS